LPFMLQHIFIRYCGLSLVHVPGATAHRQTTVAYAKGATDRCCHAGHQTDVVMLATCHLCYCVANSCIHLIVIMV
jgi:hypothetical protein